MSTSEPFDYGTFLTEVIGEEIADNWYISHSSERAYAEEVNASEEGWTWKGPSPDGRWIDHTGYHLEPRVLDAAIMWAEVHGENQSGPS